MNKFIIALIFVLGLASAVLSQSGQGWSSCGSSSDLLEIGNVVISPYPPVKGQNITITANGTLTQEVTQGNVAIDIKYGFITLYKGNQPICQSKDPIPCPIQAGEYSKSISAEIPNAAPAGKYSGQVVVTSGAGTTGPQIACININFELN